MALKLTVFYQGVVMFTGIVQAQAEVMSADTQDDLCRLVVAGHKSLLDGLVIGASVAINGVCLTVVEFYLQDEQAIMAFDVIAETLGTTGLGALVINEQVNVERSLKVGDELGGHIVSGHVHCCAEVVKIEKTATNCTLYFQCDAVWLQYVLAKGFITVNGVSLTVGTCLNGQFNVHLIPETLASTNLGTVQQGQLVNLEFDQQTMTIVTTLARMKVN